MKWWINGELKDSAEVSCSVTTYSLHYGVCVFEGIRSYDIGGKPAVFRLEDHVTRFFDSVKALGAEIKCYHPSDLMEAIEKVVSTSNAANLYIRPMYYVGDGVMGIHYDGLEENLVVSAWEWDINRDSARYRNGISVQVSRHVRTKQYAQSKVSGNYLASFAAINSIRNTDFDEAILLDEDGYLCEATAQNIFVVKENCLHTPRIKSCLDGITRQAVIDIAREAGICVVERDIMPSELLVADEAFLTGTACEILPIRQIESTKLHTLSSPSSLTAKIMAKYRALVTGESKSQAVSLSAI